MSKVSCKLEDLIIYISRGITPKYTEKSDNSCIVLNQKCIRDFSINFNPSRKNDILLKKISDEKFIEQYDVLINSTGVGTLGRVAQFLDNAPNSITVDSHITIVRPNSNKIHPLFFGYLLKSKQNEIESFAQGTTGQTELSRDDLKNMVVEFTNNKELQIKHSEFLLNIDDKIQLNTQTNQTLEAIAQAIFKSWFVDFDPVRAKAQALSEGKSEREANLSAMSVISGKAIEDLSQTEYQELWEIADAFPSELVENAEFGEVPKGWEISTIGESYNVIMGQSPSGETYNEQGNGTLFYQGRAEFGWRFPTPRLFTTNPKRMAKSNDILMSVRAPVGDLNVALENCCIGRGLCALSHKSGEFSFGFYQMKNLKSVLDVFNGEGTVFGSINQKDLKSIPVLNPHQEIIALFNKFVFDIDNKIKNNVKENQQLEKIRDLLLPKLLSGELLNE